MTFDYEEERDLTACETLIMKSIWDADKDLKTMELREILRERFEKDYAVATLRTFLVKLSDKGFIKNYRVKQNAYIHPLKSEEDYRAEQFQKQKRFWHNGKSSDMVCAMLHFANDLTKDDRDKIRGILDAWDECAD